jgi:capsid assembly protease
MRLQQEQIWAGTETSLSNYLAAVEQRAGMGMDKLESDSELLEINGSIGVISIKGSLTNTDSFWNALMGVTSYPQIREALVEAASNPDVQSILLDIDSGGGSVSGVADTANLIKMIDSKIKPVVAFTDGTMCSAAYWLGSSAREVFSSATAMVGSLGVIATHAERSQQLKNDGIGVTVIRSGQYKALANGVEPLTKEAESQIQGHLDGVYKVFAQHVADSRGVDYATADTVMGQGREFLGQAAVDAGLVDGIKTYDEVMALMSLEKSIDTSKSFMDNSAKSKGGNTLKATLETPEAQVDAEITDPGVDADTSAETTGSAASAEADSGLVAFLQAQIKEKDAALIAANVDISKLTDQYSAVKSAHDGLMAIAKKSLSVMRVATGGTAAGVDALSATALLSEHESLAAQYQDKFKVGGVAAVDVVVDAKPPVADPQYLARVNAARFQK